MLENDALKITMAMSACRIYHDYYGLVFIPGEAAFLSFYIYR